MATTRIIPMHVNKGKTIAQCLTERTDYAKNPDKTEDGEYISAYVREHKPAQRCATTFTSADNIQSAQLS